MSRENESLSDEARNCIRQHLSAIERAMAEAGASLDERRAVTADVESQILDMLGVPEGAEPTLREVEHVIARLDKPADYAAAVALPQETLAEVRHGTDPVRQRRTSRRKVLVAALAGACVTVLFFFTITAAFVAMAARRADQAKRQAMRAQMEALEAVRRQRRLASPAENEPNENRP